MKPDKETSG